MRYGIDIAWGARGVNPRALGATFVARYYSHDKSKSLSPDEARRYTALGIDIITVFEDGARNVLGGYNQGKADALFALARARECGQPTGTIIRFAGDDDFSPGDQPTINSYFNACNEVLHGHYVTSGYGGYYVLKRLGARIVVPWQTAAWSGGQWLPNSIQQYSFGQLYDWNRTNVANFGQWRVGQRPHTDPPVDPDWFLLPDERSWVHTFDHFETIRRAQHGKLRYWGRSHEQHMIRLMTVRRKQIWYVAQKSGWQKLHRDLRYRALRQRTEQYAREEHLHPS